MAEHRSAVQRRSEEKCRKVPALELEACLVRSKHEVELIEQYSEQCKMLLIRPSKLNEVLFKDSDREDVLFVKSIPHTTENWLRKLYKYSMNNNTITEDKHETNHINNKYM